MFYENEGNVMTKYPHYLDAYDPIFQKYRDRKVSLVEIGVGYGGSLQLWKKYLGAQARVYGIDLQDCRKFNEPQIEVFVGDQADVGFLKGVFEKIGGVDIVIDDGSHRCEDQIKSFETVFPFVANDGVYIIEDVHTSYRPGYGGGLYCSGSLIEYMKQYIDDLHYAEWGTPRNTFWRNIESINFYQSLVVVRKTDVNRDGPHTTGLLKMW